MKKQAWGTYTAISRSFKPWDKSLLLTDGIIAEARSYRKIIVDMARYAYRKLPAQVRVWLDIQELINDGFVVFLRCKGIALKHQIDNLKGLLQDHLAKHYLSAYIEPYCKRLKRFKIWTDVNGNHQTYGSTFSIDGVMAEARERSPRSVEVEDVMRYMGCTNYSVYSDPTLSQQAEFGFLRVYRNASERLQQELIRWFLPLQAPGGTARIHMKGPQGRRFRIACKEFRMLASRYQFTMNEAQHLLNSPVSLDRLSRSIFDVSYDLNHPAPECELIFCHA